MKQYLIYGTKKDWSCAQCAPSPVLRVADSKEEALDSIVDEFFTLFNEAVKIMDTDINPSAALKILTGVDFSTSETSEDENILINEDSGCIIYDDTGFMDDNNIDAATTLILGLMELSIESHPDNTSSRTETVIKISLEDDILPRFMAKFGG